jgi:SAM-dependent methyltransferase
VSEHGFTAVDRQRRPRDWIDVLDRMRREPFYAAYKLRVAELLEPVAGGRYLELGAGTGDDARALERRYRSSVVGVDSSETMVAEARRRGLENAVVADAHELPFADASFDGCWADRTFQHLADPHRALAEAVRVMRAGGRLVTVDPDYTTQVVAIDDVELAERVRRYRAEVAIRNGTLAHRMGRLFAAAGLSDLTVEARTLVVRDPSAVDDVMGLRGWAAHACGRGFLTAEDVRAWEGRLDEAVASGTFLYAVTFFLTAGTLPGR